MKRSILLLSLLYFSLDAKPQIGGAFFLCTDFFQLFEGGVGEVKVSELANQRAYFIGGKAWFNTGTDLQLGLGFNTGIAPTYYEKYETQYDITIEQIAFCAEYRIGRDDPIHFSLPLSIGYGIASEDLFFEHTDYGYVEPGINVVAAPFNNEFNFGAGVSYRRVVGASSPMFDNENLSGTSLNFFVGYGF